MMPKIKATVEILAYNNEATIEKTLASVTDFGEVIIIDGGSTDRTLEIARRYGATILEQDARGKRGGQIADFSLIRNQGLIAAKHGWFLFVDSDELITQDLAEELRSVVASEISHFYVWRVPRKYVYNGKVIDCATTYPNFQTRFFHRRHVEGFVKEIHERILPSSGESIGKLQNCMLVPLPEREVLWKKWSRYVLLEEERLRGSSRRDILIKAFNTLKAAVLYALRLPRFWFCRGNHTPFWYEFLQQRYQFALLRMLLRNLLSAVAKDLGREPIDECEEAADNPERSRGVDALVDSADLARVRPKGEMRDITAVRPWSFMKLIYISPLRYPSEKAGSAFSMKSCEAFAGEGIDVELWIPRRLNKLHGENPFLYHGVKKNFRIVRLPVIDLMSWMPSYFIMAISFAISVFFYALWRRMRGAIYYSHEEFALFLLTLIFKRTAYEIHDFPPQRYFYRRLLKRVSVIVATNNWKKNKLAELFGYQLDKILAIPNAVDINQFAINATRDEARQKLGLSLDKKIALYTGHLYSWKGVDTLLEASQLLPADCIVYFVGGTEQDVSEFEIKNEKLKIKDNIKIVGCRLHDEIPIWLRAADVLVLPNTAKEDISKYYTSPMKLFEYMASGRPIIASDLPSLRNIVDENSVFFFKPDNSQSLAAVALFVLQNDEEAKRRAEYARQDVEKYSWDIRAKSIISFLSSASY